MMMEHLRSAPFPVLGIYGGLDEASIGFRMASFMEKTRLKPLRLAKDHALPLKKMIDRRYDTYTPATILKKGWTMKHQEQIPGGLLIVYETDAFTSTTLNSAVSLFERVRANLVTSGRSTIPLAVAVVSTSDDPDLTEEKSNFLSQLRKVTMNPQQHTNANHMVNLDRNTLRTPSFNQPSPCAVGAFTKLDLDRESEVLQKFRAQIIDAIHEYYKSEIARIKAIKRGERRAGAFALKVRHEFKCAQYYEMRSIQDKALTHYQESYHSLSILASVWQKEETSEYQAHEIRSASEIVHYRICALRLELGEPRSALSQLRLHLKSMTPLLDPTRDNDEYWEWLCRQHVSFSTLLSSSSTSALSVAFGALDPCERERCSRLFHLSRAAMHAKKISRPERALDLTERLVELCARTRKVNTRREAALLISVAEERFRSEDEDGAKRDLERALYVFKKDGWYHLYVTVLSRIDSMFRKAKNPELRVPYTQKDVEAQYIVLYDNNVHRRNEAVDYLCMEPSSSEAILLETNLVQATIEDGGRRILLSSKFPKDLLVKSVHSLQDSETEFGSRVITDFVDESGLIPLLGSLLIECADRFLQKMEMNTLLLTFNTGVKWKVPLRNAPPIMFAMLKHTDSGRMENHQMSYSPRTMRLRKDAKRPQYDLICKGLPANFVGLVGESFHLEVCLSDPKEKCLIECECESTWIRINASTTPGSFVLEICPSDSIFLDQPTQTSLQLTAFVGTLQLAKKTIEFSVVWPLVLGICKRLGSNFPKYLVEFECSTIAISVKSSSINEMEGYWTPTERRATLVELSSISKLDVTIERGVSSPDFHGTGPWSFTLALPIGDDIQDKSVEDLECVVSFRPQHPYIHLGQEVEMVMSVEYLARTPGLNDTSIMSGSSETANSQILSRTIRIISEQTSGFLFSGPDSVLFNLYPAQQRTVHWSLIALEVGPQRLPGVWLEVSKGDTMVSRKRIESIDSFCVILPSSSINSKG